jgi:hypothetical protein
LRNVEIINLNGLWGLPCNVHSWELDTIDAYWIQYWHYSIVVIFFFKIHHSWDFNISDRASASIGKN